MIGRFFRLALMISWTSIVSGCHPPIPWWKSGFSGRVLDMETGIPIADAAVVAIWCADHFRMDGGPALLWVEDTVTDQKGRFRLWPRPAIVWNPFYWPMPPVLVTFRPGYRECRRGAERDNPDCRPPTIRLRKLDLVERAHADADLSGVREDVWFSSDKPSSGSCLFLPASRIPRLAILVQAEEALYGRKYSGEPLTEHESAHLWRLVLDRGADDQPPALPSPTTIAGMKFQLGRRIREASIQYLGFVYGKPGKRGRFKIGDAPPIELGPADSLPNGATVSLLSDRFAVLRLCAQPELVVALALHGREPPCADLEIWH